MEIAFDPELEAAIRDMAQREGVPLEAVVLDALRQRFLPAESPLIPRDDWERELLAIAQPCGVAPPRDAYSREEMYD